MRRIILFLSCCVFVLAAPVSHAGTKKVVLDNGLTVLVTEMPSSPVAAVQVWVKTGSANEGKFIASGITHFVEHMLFKGTQKRPAGVIPQEVRSLGGYINASTGYDHTVYVLDVPTANVERAVDLLSDMVMAPVFDAAELEREREVILKEMRMINDKPDRRLDQVVYETQYQVHPYRFYIIGREDVFRALKREDLVEYHQALYVPNNMIVSVAGGVDAEKILSLIKEKFASFQARSFPLRNLPQEPVQIFPRRVDVAYATDLTRLSMAYQGVALLDADLYALDVLAMALGQGESSRFYLELYKKQRLVESVSASDYTPQDRGFFEISCLIKDQDVEEVIGAVKRMILRVQKEGLRPEELEKVKRQVMADNIYSRQTAVGMAGKMVAEEAFTGDPAFSVRYLDGVRAVSNEDIKRVARQYFLDDKLSVVVLGPEKKIKASDQAALSGKTDIEKYVMPNGLVLLLKEDHSLPIVSLTAVFNGGTRQDPDDLQGLSTLVGSVWTKGLPGETSEDIRKFIESRGAGVSGSSGKNSLVFGMTFLSEDRAAMLDYFEKFMTKPSFPEEEIARDKEQMLTALVARKDSVVQSSIHALVNSLFETHPFRHDGIGTQESVFRVKRQDIVVLFDRYVRADNGVVAVFGDIDKAVLRKDLEKRLAKLRTGRPQLKTFAEDAPAEARSKELMMDKEQAAVLFGFRGPLITDKDRYASEVLVNILSSSLGGRIFKRVREELGKAYGLSGSVSLGIDAGMFTFLVLTLDEGAAKVRSIMEEEFLKIRTDLVAEQELSDAKAYLIGGMAKALESIGSQVGIRAVDELLGLGYKNVDDYALRIDAVTREDVRAAALKYLDVGHAAVVLTRPSGKKTGE